MATGTAPVSARRHPSHAAVRLADLVGVRAALALLIAGSTAIRAVAATAHVGPTIYPDEYIYTALARSLGTTGKPLIRGHVAHFPALLEPLLAAPLWALAPAQSAYHLVQIENALFMSLAAIPVYLLARKLEFGPGYSLVCASFAVAIPDLADSGRTLADPVAYPLALAGVYTAVLALREPTRRHQVAFLAFAFLATFARVQYIVLVPAFIGAALITRRRQVFATHRLTLGVVGAGALIALSLGPTRVLGYYKEVVHLHVNAALFGWIGSDLFLLAVAGGTVLVPGALVGLASARKSRDAAFSAMASLYALALLVAAGLYASNGSDRFQERYLFSLLPLIPLAFGLYLRQSRPAPRVVAAISAALLVVSVRLPLSHYEGGLGVMDSPLLWALKRLELLVGTGSSSLLFAAYTALGAALATTVGFGLRARVALGATLAFLVVVSILATSFDLSDARAGTSPGDPTWVDATGIGNVTAVTTPLESRDVTLDQLYWNRSVQRLLLLPHVTEPDNFSAARVRIAPNGTLLDGGRPIRSAVLYGQPAQTATFQDAQLVAGTAYAALWRPHGVARLGLLEQGRYPDGWLTPSGTITLWPKPGRRLAGVLSLDVSLPAGVPQTVIFFGSERRIVRPGHSVPIRLCVRSDRSWNVVFRGIPLVLKGDQRLVSVVQTTPPRFQSGAACATGTP